LSAPEIQLCHIKKDNTNLLISLSLFLVAFWTYLATMAPTVSFWDCGEFIACSYILGIPHPPGTPLFVLIGRIFTLLPISKEIAVRVNFISVLTSALSVWLAYLIIVRVIKYWYGVTELPLMHRIVAYAGGAVGALFLTFSSTFWSNAVEAEVYGITILLMLLITYIALLWAEKYNHPGSGKFLVLMAYLAFLGIGIHMTVFLVMPVLFVLVILIDRSKLLDWRIWMAGVAMMLVAHELVPFVIAIALLFLISFSAVLSTNGRDQVWRLLLALSVIIMVGFSVQGFLTVRAAQNPAINENNPSKWPAFKSFLERKQYGDETMIRRSFTRNGTWANQFGTHENMGFWGFFREQYSSEKYRFIPFILGALGLWESLRRRWKIGTVFLLLFLLGSVGLVLYMNFSDGTMGDRLEVRDRDYFFTPGFVFFSILIGLGFAGFILWIIELIGNSIALKMRLAIAIAISVIGVAFPLVNTRAYHWESHDRTGNYIPWDYAYNILNSCDKDAMIFTNGDNDTFPLWFLQQVEKNRTDVRVVNLSLLNTPWYIMQLKYQMGVPIRLSDGQIENILPKMTTDGKMLRVQDVMVEEIIRANNWKDPIYFAVTVSTDNRVGLEKNFRMEGMAYRIVPEKGDELIEPDILNDKLANVFRFRGIADPAVHKDVNDIRLIANYISAFLQLGEHYRHNKEFQKAVDITEKARQLYPSEWRAYAFLVQIYAEQDNFAKVEEVIGMAPKDEMERLYLNSAYAYTIVGNVDKAVMVYKKVLQANSKSDAAFKFLISLLYDNHRYRDAIDEVDEFIKGKDPNSSELSTLNRLKAELIKEMTSPPKG